MSIANNENFKICSECGGKCCNHFPGGYIPSDFKPEQLTKEGLTELLSSGNFVADKFVDGDFNSHYYLRPRSINDLAPIYWGAGGRCSRLKNSKCELKFENRPYECKYLDPKKCIDRKNPILTKEELSKHWNEYNDLILRIKNEWDIDDEDYVSPFKNEKIKKQFNDKGLYIGSALNNALDLLSMLFGNN